MRISLHVGCLVLATAGLAGLAGCSSAGTSPPGSVGPQSSGNDSTLALTRASNIFMGPPGLPPGMQRPIAIAPKAVRPFVSPAVDAPGGAYVFVSDYANNAVYIYNVAGQLTATLTGFDGPEGIAVDKAGNLYVVNDGNATIEVYAAGYKGTPTTLNDPGEYPVDVAVDQTGNVAVTNGETTSNGFGSVSFYAPGATTPTNTVSCAACSRIFYDGFDARGNLYVDGFDPNVNTLVGVVARGIKGTAITQLTMNNSFSGIGGIQVTTGGLIVVDNQATSNIVLYSYNPPNPKTRSLGSPVYTTPLQGAYDVATYAFTPKNNDLVGADTSGAAELYPYPAGGTPVRSLALPAGSFPFGVALYPPQIP